MNILIGLLIIAVGSFGQSSLLCAYQESEILSLGEFLACAGDFRLVGVPLVGCVSGGSDGS